VDFNQLAHRVVQATIDRDEPQPDEQPESPAQVNGRKGGVKGGKARAQKLTAGERLEIARNAAKARWTKPPANRQRFLDVAAFAARLEQAPELRERHQDQKGPRQELGHAQSYTVLPNAVTRSN
jgi:hypothetical protein